MTEWGKLYICGTPIGNLEDITLRGLKILADVDMIAAEDTRRTGILLNSFEINTPLTSYHEHNEKKKASNLLAKLKEGEMLALVSDAGMPGISDPGFEVISRAIEEGIEVIPIPGPSAAISALVVSGLSMERFVFEGFLPRKGKDREIRLAEIQEEEKTIIIYESPYRLQDTLKELKELMGARRLALVREISKIHEEKIYGSIAEVQANVKDKEIKGEIVLVIEGREKTAIEKEGWEQLTILEHLKLLVENGYTKKKAIKEVAKTRDIPKKKVYKEAIVINAKVEN